MQPQILPLRDIRRMEEIIYLPASSIESLTGIAAHISEDGTSIVVTVPSDQE